MCYVCEHQKYELLPHQRLPNKYDSKGDSNIDDNG